MTANSSAHAFDRHFEGLFGANGDAPIGGSAVAPRAPRTLLVPGNLPVMGGLWIPQYADRVAVGDGPVGLLRLEQGLIRVQVLRGASYLADLDEDIPLVDFLRVVARDVSVWMIAASPAHAKSIHRDFSRVTTLTGADAPAVIACYEILRDQVQELQARPALEVRPSIGVVVVGADEATSETAMRGLRKTAAAYLGFEVCLESPMPRIGSIAITIDREFTVEDAGITAALRILDDAERDAHSGLAAGHSQKRDENMDLPTGLQSGLQSGLQMGITDASRQPSAVSSITSKELASEVLSSAVVRGEVRTKTPTTENADANPVERFSGRRDRGAPLASSQPDTIPFEIWRRPSAMARPNAAHVRSALSATERRAPVTSVMTPTRSTRDAQVHDARKNDAGNHEVGSTSPVGLPPKPASVVEVHSVDPTWPTSLVPWMQGLTRFEHTSPYDPTIEIAIDEGGALHVVGRAEELPRLLRVHEWIHQHAALLAKAEPRVDMAREVTIDLVTNGVRRVDSVVGPSFCASNTPNSSPNSSPNCSSPLASVRWHALIGVLVAGRKGMLIQPYANE